jgi:AraC-like DNA-binding protein
MIPFEFDFRPRTPSAPLDRFVESIWYARGTVPYARERIAPTGSTVAVIVLGDPIVETAANGDGPPLRAETGFIIGPHVGPVINAPTGETFALGVVTTPVGCEAVFGVSPDTLRGQVKDLSHIWPDLDAVRRTLLDIATPDAMLDRLESALHQRLTPAVPGTDRCAQAVGLLESDPTRPIADIADDLGISHAHLDREFTRIVGLTPRALARLLKLRRLLSELDGRKPIDWADLAAQWGWFDQGHLIRDFKRHTGVTPTQYLSAQKAAYGDVGPDEAAGFIPEA